MHALSRPLLLLVLAAPAAGQEMLTVNWSGVVNRTDLATGATVEVGPSGFTQLNSLARSSAGEFYSVEVASNFVSGMDRLIRIDPDTGAATAIATLSLLSIRALAFGPGDVLYAIEDGTFGLDDGLFRLDTSTGAATLVGSTTMEGVQAMAYGAGKMYAHDCKFGLVTIDLGTGAASDVHPAFDGSCLQFQGLGFDDEGRLFGGWTMLHEVDLSTGLGTVVGGPTKDMRGLDLVSTTSLDGDPEVLSIATGGVQSLALKAGVDFAGLPYLLLGSISGSMPGTAIDGFTLPLNPDAYTITSLQSPNTPPLAGSFGTLDAAGRASATFTLPTGLSTTTFVGLEVNHAFVVLELTPTLLQLVFVSEAAPLTLVP